ncbi:MAG TPA: type VI secretion protein IcmF/TssM N-terminal domain-containing protein [Polyangiaceae bacterium]|nr:type VI secretion protein IcmF/TssM N-terminal domain-containing protein [Polyangiaceae bacterium]
MKWIAFVLLTLVLAGLWAVALLFPVLQLLWLAELLTVLVVLLALLPIVIPGLVQAWRWFREARRRAAEADKANPHRSPAQAGIRAAIKEMARVRGRRAARSLPAYLVLGTAGSGRRTFVRALGLSAIEPRASRTGIESLTRDISLWASQEAIAVVTEGGVPADPEAQASFEVLLDELRRFRPVRPVDGIVLVVPLGPAVGDFEFDAMAAKARRQIDAGIDRLGVRVPIYIVLTKVDQVPGFDDFWTDLERPDELSWGASFTTDDPLLQNDSAQAVERELDVLFAGLHARVFDRVLRERDPVRRLRVLNFPEKLRAAVTHLPSIARSAFQPGASQETARLRGFYFTSSHRPGLDSARPGVAGGAGTLFVRDLLRSVLLPDRNLAAETSMGRESRSKRQGIAAAIAIGVSACLLGPALGSFTHNTQLAQRASAVARALRTADAKSSPGLRDDPLEATLDTLVLAEADERSFSIPYWVSPRSAIALEPPLHDAYFGRLDAWMTSSVRKEIERRLDAVSTAVAMLDVSSDANTPSAMQQAYDTVRLAAMLADPSHAKGPWASEKLAALWLALLHGRDAVDVARLAEHSRRYFAELPQLPSSALWSSLPALARARAALQRLRAPGVMEMPLHRVLAATKDVPDINATSLFDGSALGFVSSQGVHVPGCYTASGWAKVREALRSLSAPDAPRVERWVVGGASLPTNDDELQDAVVRLYFQSYVDAWTQLLEAVQVRSPSDAREAKAELAAFKQGRGFYRSLFDAFQQNTIRVEDDGSADAGGLLSGALAWWHSQTVDASAKAPSGPSPVERSFRPVLEFAGVPAAGSPPAQGDSALDKYLKILDDLDVALDAPPPPAGPGTPDAQSPFAIANAGVARLLEPISEPTRSRLGRILMPPVRGVVTIIVQGGQKSLSDQWRNEIYAAWQPLSAKYPFARGGAPAQFSDFKAFLAPEGPLWKFVHEKMANLVEESGENAYRSKPGATPEVSGAILECLSVARQISNAYFPPGEDPGLKMSIEANWNASDVDTVKWVAGGKETPLPKGQWAGPIRWLGEDVRVDWLEGGRLEHQSGSHAFSLYGFFQHLGGLHPVEGSRTVFKLDSPPLELKVRWEGRGDASALQPEFLARLHCPDGW